MSTGPGVPLHRRMSARDPHELRRVATPLELFFDLVFVVAIASAAAEWHHGLAAGHLSDLVGFVTVFFAIWWAWMNDTWFASSFDCDDVGYRLLTVAIMGGSLMLAAGVPDLFATGQSGLLVAGYAVMRFAMVVMWLRAAASHPEGRPSALRYAVGIALVQVLWIARLLIDGRALLLASFVVLVAFELLVPVLAGRRGFTPFHPHHIAERYALLTLIVLGEVILAAVQAVQGALVDGGRPGLLALAVGGLLLVFASVAATGAALAAAVELVQGEAEASNRVVGLGVTVLVTGLVLAAVVCHHVWTSQRQSTGWSSPLSTS